MPLAGFVEEAGGRICMSTVMSGLRSITVDAVGVRRLWEASTWGGGRMLLVSGDCGRLAPGGEGNSLDYHDDNEIEWNKLRMTFK